MILPYHLAEERLTEESASTADHLGTTRRDRAVLSRQGRPGPRRPGRRPLPSRAVSATTWPGSLPTRTACWRRCFPTSRPFDARPSPTNTWATPRQLRPIGPRHDDLAARGPRPRPPAALRGGAGVAAGRRPRQLSLCDQLQQQRGGDRGGLGSAHAAHRPLDRRGQGLHHPRRGRAVSRPSRTTRPASESAGSARSTAPSPAVPGAAAGSTPSRSVTRPGSAARPRSR